MQGSRIIGTAVCLFVTFVLSRSAAAQPPDGSVYRQPQSPNGGIYQSSWVDPDGSDYDQYVWDDFTLKSAARISSVAWTGAYNPLNAGSGGKVLDFIITFLPSIPGGSQPDVAHAPLAEYRANGNADETSAEMISTTRFYTYSFILPGGFEAQAETKYWIGIEASQHGIPDWGIASATSGGDGMYFRRIANVGDFLYQSMQGDAAFSLTGETVTNTAGQRTTEFSAKPNRIDAFRILNAASVSLTADRFFAMDDLLGRAVGHRLPPQCLVARRQQANH